MLSHFTCIQLCNRMDCSPPGFSVHRIPQARILKSTAMPSIRESSWPRDQTHISCGSWIAGRVFTTEPLGKPQYSLVSPKPPVISFLSVNNKTGSHYKVLSLSQRNIWAKEKKMYEPVWAMSVGSECRRRFKFSKTGIGQIWPQSKLPLFLIYKWTVSEGQLVQSQENFKDITPGNVDNTQNTICRISWGFFCYKSSGNSLVNMSVTFLKYLQPVKFFLLLWLLVLQSEFFNSIISKPNWLPDLFKNTYSKPQHPSMVWDEIQKYV